MMTLKRTGKVGSAADANDGMTDSERADLALAFHQGIGRKTVDPAKVDAVRRRLSARRNAGR
ncbi:hypothetical protein SAMN06295924_101232 [Rathayibacter rathayi NCPPB 2980 = VKM Ac-1601]|nr:hypothetical protein FB469_1118 [Rathayibacter rathayi]SOE02083.1 hypothetical protein SAMN06295924_101232 [Rathayibacter rathayi NCPPB 2980 = VKM Ac-1601]